jgi:hypothetical protein
MLQGNSPRQAYTGKKSTSWTLPDRSRVSAICLGRALTAAAGVLTLRSRLIISWSSATGSLLARS